MKYLKTFELDKNEPEVGDYVICEESKYPNIKKFISTNIGKIIYYIDDTESIGYKLYKNYRYIVKYNNMPKKFDSFNNKTRRMKRDEIIHWSKNKEDLEIILNSKKYNL
jgi:hypothetical protein